MLLIVKDDTRVETVGVVGTGDKGIDQTAAAMRGLVKAYAGMDAVRKLAAALRTPENVYHWAAAHVRFEDDPKGVELIRVPTMLIRQVNRDKVAYGDCDDNTVLCCSVLAAMGLTPVIAVLGKVPRNRGGKFVHVLPGFIDPNGTATFGDIRTNADYRLRQRGNRWGFTTDAGWALLFDAQERREVGHLPPEPMRRIYVATGEHAA